MRQTLVTIATYWDTVEARLARIHLEAAGIRSTLQNEHSVTMNWLEFANASRGVELQVDEPDVDAAIEVLERKAPEADEIGDDWKVERETSIGDDEETEAESILEDADGLENVAEEPLNRRERQIQRAYRSAMLGLIFLPVEFYCTYLLGASLLSDESIRPSIQKTARNAVLLNLCVLFVYFSFALQCSHYAVDPAYSIYSSFVEDVMTE